jgi:hypothetical protein
MCVLSARIIRLLPRIIAGNGLLFILRDLFSANSRLFSLVLSSRTYSDTNLTCGVSGRGKPQNTRDRRQLVRDKVVDGFAELGNPRNAVPVTADNFNRAETDMYFGKRVKGGRIGNLSHSRELYLTDSPVVRPNRDTLYSGAVLDFDAGPVTITLPDADNRFMSMQVTARWSKNCKNTHSFLRQCMKLTVGR